LQQTDLYQVMFQHATIGILIVNNNGSIVKANTFAEKLFGYATNELEGQSVDILVPDALRGGHAKHRHSYHQKPKDRVMGANLDLYAKCKDESTFPVEISLGHTEFDGKQMAIAYINDITDRKKANADLEENKSRLAAIIDNAADGIITISRMGIVESINPAAAKLFGYTPEEVVGNNIKMLMPEPDKSSHDQYLDNHRTTKVKKIIGIGREVTGLKKDGTTFPFHLSVSEVKFGNKTIYTSILHDLTDQKIAEEKMRRYAQALERSNRELQDFAYVSSHDLQEPLRKIRAFGDRLKIKEGDKLGEKGKDYLNRMLNAAERMQRLITDLLQFSRVNTRSKSFEKVSLTEVVEGVLADLEIAIEKSKAKIEVGELPSIEADETQMRQLFQNLIANAIKFRKAEEVPYIQIKSELHQRKAHLISTPGDTYVKITVQDNGIGFDDKYKDKIFQIFQRLEGRKFEGSGIGLAICKRIANRHGGDILATSETGKGTTFEINLATKQSIKEEHQNSCGRR